MTSGVPTTRVDDGSPLTPDVDPSASARAEPTGRPIDIHRIGDVLGEHGSIRWLGVNGLFVLAVFYTLYFAEALLFPILLAMLLNLLLSPVVRWLKRAHIPEPVGAAIVLLVLLGVIGGGVYSLADPAREWSTKAPAAFAQVQAKLRKLRRPVEQVSRTAEQISKATTVNDGSRATEVVVKGPSLTERFFGQTQTILTGAVEVLLLLYFLLAAGDLFLQKLIRVLPQFRDKKKAVTIARETEASVSVYLFTISLINIGIALAVTGAMLLLGMPNAVLWGVLAGLLEFVPYVGAAVMIGMLSVAGLATFDTVGHALLVPAVYLAINFVQGNLVTPHILGRRLTLNPVAIFIGLIFWWWIWGVPGAFIAVPLMASFKILCDHIEVLAPVGEFLGK